jgi:branched-chain amino acid transport system substrate-binding protein
MDTIANFYTTSLLAGPLGSKEMREPTELFKKYFPNDKLQSLNFYGTSGAHAIVEALKRAGPNLTREKFIDAMESIKDMPAGPAFCRISFSKTDHQGCKEGTVWAVRNGAIVPIGPVYKKDL